MLSRLFISAALICLVAAPVALADDNDSDWGGVFVEILPTVDVTYSGGFVDLGQANANDLICANLDYVVHANGQQIGMRCGASVLYKDDNPSASNIIPVDETTEATITAYYDTWTDAQSLLPIFDIDYPLGPYGVVTIHHTDWMEFASGDGGTWSYPVSVDICWRGYDAEIFQGRYSGAIVLWAVYRNI
jgi:hypothetical protein